jgi:hypothetical protein
VDALETKTKLARQIFSGSFLGEIHQEHVEQVAITTEATPIPGVRPEMIYGPTPMDDAKATGTFGRPFNTEAGVLYRGILLPVASSAF